MIDQIIGQIGKNRQAENLTACRLADWKGPGTVAEEGASRELRVEFLGGHAR